MTAGECDDCKFESSCQNGDCRCSYEWLNAEYVEPYKPPENDSWDKIEQDSQMSVYEYCNKYLNHLSKSDYTAQNIGLDLVRRCKALAAKERNDNDY
jgi:hypothetical protein